MNIRKVLPLIAVLLLAPVIRAGAGSTLSPEDTDRTKRIERILVFSEFSSDADHEVGGNAAKHRRRRADRVRVGNRRSCVDDGAGRQDDARLAQGHVSECALEAGRWGWKVSHHMWDDPVARH